MDWSHPALIGQDIAGFIAPISIWSAIAISAVVRVRRGKPILARVTSGVKFIERRASGRSLRNLVTRISGARGVLLVTVTSGKITVQPHFPFTLLFMPELYGLEVQITADQLRKVSEKRRGTLIIDYSHPSRGDEQFELKLRDPKGFMEAVAAMKAQGLAA